VRDAAPLSFVFCTYTLHLRHPSVSTVSTVGRLQEAPVQLQLDRGQAKWFDKLEAMYRESTGMEVRAAIMPVLACSC